MKVRFPSAPYRDAAMEDLRAGMSIPDVMAKYSAPRRNIYRYQNEVRDEANKKKKTAPAREGEPAQEAPGDPKTKEVPRIADGGVPGGQAKRGVINFPLGAVTAPATGAVELQILPLVKQVTMEQIIDAAVYYRDIKMRYEQETFGEMLRDGAELLHEVLTKDLILVPRVVQAANLEEDSHEHGVGSSEGSTRVGGNGGGGETATASEVDR